MENYSLVEEENNQRSGSTAPVSMSVGSLVKIDSISIDLGTSKEKKEAGKCHHFSIRGYVADKRNKDIKICVPFPSDGNETELSKQLEPLYVAKYKWWRCQSCVQEIIAASALDDLPDSQETSPIMNGDKSYPSLCCYEKEKHSPAERTAVRAAMESKGSDLVDICEPNPGIGEAANAVLAIEYPGCKGSSPADNCLTGKGNPLNEEQRNSLIASETSKEVLNIDVTTCAVKDATIRHPSLELEERDSDSFKCDKPLAEDNRQIKHLETSIGLPRRKTRKVRLITDLLKDKGNVESNQIASCNAVSNALAELASSSDQRKRKMPQEPSRVMSCPNNLVKKVRASKGDAEMTIKTIEIYDSGSEKDVSAGIGFRSYMPLQQTGEKMPCSSKIKNKMPQGKDGQASFTLQKSMVEEISRENIGLDLSLRSYMDVENKSNTFFPKKNVMPDNEHWRKDGRFIGKSSASDLSFGKNVLSDLNETIAHRRGILRQQQNSTLSLHNKLDFPLRCSKGKAVECEERLAVGTHTAKRSENVSEQKCSDEVPMEIVELMAKNQYERGLSEANRSSCLSKEITNRYERGLYEMRRFGPVNGNGVMRLAQKEHKKWNPVNFSRANSNFAKTSTSRTIRNSETQNHSWNGDKTVHRSSPTRIQRLDAYKTSHTGPQQYGNGGNIWSSVAPGNTPARPNISQKLESRTSNVETHSLHPELHKGKKVRDLDLNIADPNAADLETSPEYPVVTKDVGLDPNRKDMGSLDSFSNETIPAMQLLSLMDARMQSRAPFRDAVKKILEKPLLEKPLFPHNRQFSEFSGLGPATCKAGGSARQMPSAYNGQEFARPQEADKAKRSFSPSQNKDWISRKPASTSGVSDTIRDSNPRQDKQKGILGASDVVVFPLQRQSSTSYIDPEASHMKGTIRPLTSTTETLNCVVNKNPADFSTPDAGNEYMIRVEDLRLGKKDYCGSKIGGVDGRKRRRVPKFTAPKEHVQSQRP